MQPTVVAVSRNPRHSFSKSAQPAISLVAGYGVHGDAHYGDTVQHVYLRRRNPDAPNRMQVHLLPVELLELLAEQHRPVSPGQLGENITTCDVDLSHLPLGTRLHLGGEAVVELTGLRTPCRQIDTFQPGLMHCLLDKAAPPRRRSLAGVMAIVLRSGAVQPGERIGVELPRSSVPQPLEHI